MTQQLNNAWYSSTSMLIYHFITLNDNANEKREIEDTKGGTVLTRVSLRFLCFVEGGSVFSIC